ncbi:MAG: hypothetical protein RBQ97_06875 [Acholeplasma sp.]|nr:hypothetical protein [Acholeplasma sp.]
MKKILSYFLVFTLLLSTVFSFGTTQVSATSLEPANHDLPEVVED